MVTLDVSTGGAAMSTGPQRRHHSCTVTRRIALGYAAALAVARPGITAPAGPAAVVAQVLAASDRDLDYTRAKIAFDRLVDPSFSDAEILAELDRLAQAAKAMAGTAGGEKSLLVALQREIYEPGPWNDNRPFSYDHADPFGHDLRNQLLATYLQTREGNCVSMPMLYLVLADRLGLVGAHLAEAPLHFFIRYVTASGREFNLETTSGAHTARDEWYRQNLPMTDKAVSSGLYLRALSRREAVATMADIVVENLLKHGRYDDAIAVSDVILRNAPLNAHVMAKRGTAFAKLLDAEFAQKYERPDLISPALQSRYAFLAAQNQAAFAAAEALGWQPVK